jgi:hypothetical protein
MTNNEVALGYEIPRALTLMVGPRRRSQISVDPPFAEEYGTFCTSYVLISMWTQESYAFNGDSMVLCMHNVQPWSSGISAWLPTFAGAI